MDRVTDDIAAKLTASLSAGVSEDAMKAINKVVEDITSKIDEDIMWRLKDDLAPNLTGFVLEMTHKTVEAILNGNEAEMRRYLSCDNRGWTGRSDGYTGNRDIAEMHPMIHGSLFEQGCVKLRRDIVNAHREMLVDERILDLEDQVKSLVAQVNKANVEKDRMWERLRAVSA